jgi:hypothetical protein
MIGDLATEQVPLWAAHWLAHGMDGDALRTLAGLDGSDSPTVWEILPGALEDTHTPIPHNVPDAVTVAYRDLGRLHLDGKISTRWLIAKIEGLVVSADNADDYLDPPLGALYGFDDEWGAGWGRTEDELTALLREACIQQSTHRACP